MWHPGPPQSKEVLDQVMAEHDEKLMADLRLLAGLARRQRDETRWKLLLGEIEIRRLRADRGPGGGGAGLRVRRARFAD
jgi:hypothetical protein